MELELKTVSYSFYEISPQRVAVQERTGEVIVPDSQPDILRICGVFGGLYGPGPNPVGGAAEFRPVLRAAVLYAPEDGDGICAIPVNLELPYRAELGEGAEQQVLLGGASLVSLDARVINPRKVLVRAEAAYRVSRAVPAGLTLPVSAVGSGVETLTEAWDPRVLCAAGTRDFSVEDVFSLPAAAPAAREVLSVRAALTAGEYNVLGRRLVFKGALTLDLLYRTVAGELAEYSCSLPFSQIAELEGLEEDAECVISLGVTSAEVRTAPDGEGRSLECSVGCEARITAYAHRHFEAVTDLYALGMQATVETGSCAFPALQKRIQLSASFRETAETSRPVREVRCKDLSLSPLRLAVDPEGAAKLTGEAEVRLCCLDEGGEPSLLRRRVPVSFDLGTVEPGELSALCDVRAENLAASPGAGSGVDLRFDLCGTVCLLRRTVLAPVVSARIDPLPADAPPRPSVVLRAPAPGDTLWALAKRYGSTVAELAGANGIDAASPTDPAPAGRTLLIPKTR